MINTSFEGGERQYAHAGSSCWWSGWIETWRNVQQGFAILGIMTGTVAQIRLHLLQNRIRLVPFPAKHRYNDAAEPNGYYCRNFW